MKEVFKKFPIKDLENHYEVSNLGRVYSYKYNRFLSMYINNTGYYTTQLGHNKKTRSFLVHRLIMLAFIPNPENKRTVNHKDGNKLNNSLDNLEWATYKENFKHGIDTQLIIRARGEKIGCAKLTEKDVKEIRYKFNNNKNIIQAELARQYNVGHATIWRVVNNKNWKHII